MVLDPAPVLVAGDRLVDRFAIIGLLGRGAMGEVYEARDEELDQHVALKLMRPEAVDDESLARFRREVALARTVTHPNVCRVFDWFRDDHRGDDRADDGRRPLIFLTMELLAGGETLAERLRRVGPMAPAAALDLAEPMIAALAAAHAVGVVHRDFKSANVMLVPGPAGQGERVVVTDFGMAQRSASKVAPARLTATGHWVGTPAYMAPEQVRGEPVTRRTDVYALGVTLFEMVTGHLPFDAASAFDAAVRRLSEPAPSPRESAPDLPSAWEVAIGRCLERDPADRFEQVEDVLTALYQAPSSVGRQPVGRWVGGGAVALVLALGLALGLWTRSRPHQPAKPGPKPESESVVEQDALDRLMRTGFAAFQRGDTGAAVAAFEQAYVGSLELGDSAHVQRAAGRLAAMLQMRGELQQALTVHERARAYYRLHNDGGALAAATFNMGALRATLGELTRARSLLGEALGRYRDEGSLGGEATARYALGDLEAKVGNLATAIEQYRVAFTLREDLGRPASAARVATSWAWVEAEMGDLPAAHARVDRAVETLRASEGHQGLAPALAAVARMARLEDRLQDARQALEEAMAIRRARGDEMAVQDTLCDLARLSISEGVPALAVPVARRAAARFANAGMRNAELRARLIVLEALFRMPDREEALAAMAPIRRLARTSQGLEGRARARMAELVLADKVTGSAHVGALQAMVATAESRLLTIEAGLAVGEFLLRTGDVEAGRAALAEAGRQAAHAGFLSLAHAAERPRR